MNVFEFYKQCYKRHNIADFYHKTAADPYANRGRGYARRGVDDANYVRDLGAPYKAKDTPYQGSSDSGWGYAFNPDYMGSVERYHPELYSERPFLTRFMQGIQGLAEWYRKRMAYDQAMSDAQEKGNGSWTAYGPQPKTPEGKPKYFQRTAQGDKNYAIEQERAAEAESKKRAEEFQRQQQEYIQQNKALEQEREERDQQWEAERALRSAKERAELNKHLNEQLRLAGQEPNFPEDPYEIARQSLSDPEWGGQYNNRALEILESQRQSEEAKRQSELGADYDSEGNELPDGSELPPPSQPQAPTAQPKPPQNSYNAAATPAAGYQGQPMNPASQNTAAQGAAQNTATVNPAAAAEANRRLSEMRKRSPQGPATTTQQNVQGAAKPATSLANTQTTPSQVTTNQPFANYQYMKSQQQPRNVTPPVAKQTNPVQQPNTNPATRQDYAKAQQQLDKSNSWWS